MIQPTSRNGNERAYREDIFLDSSSSLKEFSFDRKKYYKKYMLNESVEEEDSKASIMGKITETLLLEPEKFDSRFYLSACVSSPTGMMLDFVESLYTLTKEATDEDGTITRTFEDISREAYLKSGYKISYERVIQNFAGSEAEIYYNEIRNVRSKGLIVVTPNNISTGEKIVEELKTNHFIGDVVNIISSKRYDVRNQYQIEDFVINGFHLKAMIDKIIIDKFSRTIQVYDLKCVWSVENFYENYYLYRRAYIQAYVYYIAAHSLCQAGSEYEGYTILPPKFIVCDSTSYYSSLIYSLTKQDLIDAYEGFVYKGIDYPGTKNIIEDLSWALRNDIWNISRKNYESKGIVKLK